jgi:hypothetical protein
MRWGEAVTSVAGILGVLGVLWLGMMDGLQPETLIIAILTIAGLGGYKVLKDYLELRKK